MAHFREVLKDKNFLFFWLGQIISQFGDRLNQMALVAFIHSRAPGSTVELAKLLSFTILPVFLVGPVAGVYVDRLNRRWLMIACDISRSLLVLLIPVALLKLNVIYPIYITIFLVFSVTRFFVPSKMSIIPDIVSQDKLLAANSLASVTGMIASVVGFGAGGILVAMLGVEGGFYLDSASYLISALFLVFIATNGGIKVLSKPGMAKIRKSVFKEFKEGIGYLLSHRESKFVTAIFFLLMAGVGSVYVVIIVFIQETLKSATRDLGLILMLIGAGLFAGALTYGRFGGKLSRVSVIFWQLMFSGVALGLFSISLKLYPSFSAAATLGFILGVVVSPILVSANTLLQEVVRDDMRGRIFSSLEMASHLAFLIFMFATALSAEYIDRGWILLGIAFLFSFCGLIGTIAYNRRRRVIV